MNAYQNQQDLEEKRRGGTNLLWGVAAAIAALLVCTVNTSAVVLGASFGAKILAVIAGALVGWLGALIGNAIRKFAQPDFVITTGGAFSLIWIKLFWMAGPQVIGLLLGVFFGAGLVLS